MQEESEMESEQPSERHVTEPEEEQTMTSEDREVQESGRSTDWEPLLRGQEALKMQKPEELKEEISDSHSDEEAYQDDDFEEESHRLKSSQRSNKQDPQQEEDALDNLDDLESYPEDALESMGNEAMEAKADQMAEALLQQLLEEAKRDNKFTLEVEEVKEHNFRNKFPYTVLPTEDILAELPQDEPSEYAKKIADIKAEPTSADYQKNEDKVQAVIKEVSEYVEFMKRNIRVNELVESLERPIKQDPMKVLQRI
jgi:hypothetical protein